MSWAVTMRPPNATSPMMRYISQNVPVRIIWKGVELMELCTTRSWIADIRCAQPAGAHPTGGAIMNCAATTTTMPWMMPHTMKADW